MTLDSELRENAYQRVHELIRISFKQESLEVINGIHNHSFLKEKDWKISESVLYIKIKRK